MSSNVKWEKFNISKTDRSKIKNQRPCILWFTGLSGSGKSTIANAVDLRLFKMKVHTYLIDGDNIRHGLNMDLGFNNQDRSENIRRIGEVSKLFIDSGIIVLIASISPFRHDREKIRELVNVGDFVEIFVDTPLDVCKKRDPKGLYKKAITGEIDNFTGINSPYENPISPEIKINTVNNSIDLSAELIINFLLEKGYIYK